MRGRMAVAARRADGRQTSSRFPGAGSRSRLRTVFEAGPFIKALLCTAHPTAHDTPPIEGALHAPLRWRREPYDDAIWADAAAAQRKRVTIKRQSRAAAADKHTQRTVRGRGAASCGCRSVGPPKHETRRTVGCRSRCVRVEGAPTDRRPNGQCRDGTPPNATQTQRDDTHRARRAAPTQRPTRHRITPLRAHSDCREIGRRAERYALAGLAAAAGARVPASASRTASTIFCILAVVFTYPSPFFLECTSVPFTDTSNQPVIPSVLLPTILISLLLMLLS